MAATGLEQTPADQKSGLPLPILPFENAHETSWHHHAHPRNVKALKEAGGMVVRTVRVQQVAGPSGAAIFDEAGRVDAKYGPHQRYHLFYGGPPLPETRREQFEYCVWASAGYVPKEALDVSGDSPEIVSMTSEKILLLKDRDLNISDRSTLSAFLKDYLFDQDLSHVKGEMIDEFVSTNDDSRKRFLGHWLLAQASEKATEPLEPTFREAYKVGLVKPSVSAKVANVVRIGLGTQKMRDKIVDEYRFRLAS
jgi:hypothetical protein